jgi:hypothetical protein
LFNTGRISSSNGGGFLGQGAAQDQDASGAGAVTTIRYTGPAAASAATVGVTAAGSRTIVLDSAAGIAMGTPLQAVLDNGDTFWTSARLTPAGTTLYIENEVPAGRSIPAGASILIASNPVVRVSGPIVDPVLTGIHIDAGNLAAIGLELVHVIQGRGTGGPGGVSVANHTGIGGYFRTWPAPFGNYSGSVNGEYEFSALKPANNRAIGLWLLGPALNNMAYSRNRFHGGTLMMGGHDAAAAALRVEHADNNVFLKPFTYYSSGYFTPGNLGAGLYRQASIDGGNFPVENTYYGAAFLGGVTDAPATGVSLGADLFLQYGTGDGEPLPGRTSGPGLSTAGSLFNLKDLSFVSGVSSPATLNFRDPSGTYIWGLGRGGPSANGLSVESLSDVGFYVGAGAIGGGGLALAIDFKRHLRASGPAPALTACGTSPGVVGSDVAGTVTMGTSSPAGCVITFAQPYVAAPICNVSWRGNLAAMGYTTAPASLTLTQTPTSSNKVDYACWAQAGG